MKLRLLIGAAAAAIVLAACGGGEKETPAGDTPGADTPAVEAPANEATETPTETAARDIPVLEPQLTDAQLAALDAALAAQPDEVKARYEYRHPRETIAAFGIEPGMTVIEVLPGGGWYSKILIPYLGDDGMLIGADYSWEMWSKFGGFATEQFLEDKEIWAEQWVEDATEWLGDNETELAAFAFETRQGDLEGLADFALMVRAFHHLNRFNTEEMNHMKEALSDLSAVLKDDGMLGIVQHRGPEGNDDAWANGDNGYLKQSDVIKWVEAEGFELVGASEINANPKDQPDNDDIVWRLPPTLGTSGDNPDLRAEMQAIGESDRMTLLFRKK